MQPNIHRTHAAPAVQPSKEWRARVKRGVDLCRRDPVRSSWSVRRKDQLVADGMAVEAAHRQALDEAGA